MLPFYAALLCFQTEITYQEAIVCLTAWIQTSVRRYCFAAQPSRTPSFNFQLVVPHLKRKIKKISIYFIFPVEPNQFFHIGSFESQNTFGYAASVTVEGLNDFMFGLFRNQTDAAFAASIVAFLEDRQKVRNTLQTYQTQKKDTSTSQFMLFNVSFWANSSNTNRNSFMYFFWMTAVKIQKKKPKKTDKIFFFNAIMIESF